MSKGYRQCAKNSHLNPDGAQHSALSCRFMVKRYCGRFVVGQIVRFVGSPSSPRHDRLGYLAMVEFVEAPVFNKDLNVRLASGKHVHDLAERFTPVYFAPTRVWTEACESYRTSEVCYDHGITPGDHVRRSLVAPEDARSEGARRYDTEHAALVPSWASLEYSSKEDMGRALA